MDSKSIDSKPDKMPQIRRKPVAQNQPRDLKPPVSETIPGEHGITIDPGAAYDEAAEEGRIEDGEARPGLDEQLENLQLETENEDLPSPYPDGTLPEEAALAGAEQSGSSTKSSKIKAVLGEVKHYAGGLVRHPYEATKHYSVMRHSHGLVYYQGPTTSVAITVFSDEPLPPDRKLWLQKRGFSGKVGLKVGATLGSRSAWIDVTPAIDATAELLPPSDERAWQRDISSFLKKTKNVKHIRNHRPYETDVVRVPHVAEDGYFRIVLCADRKVLCPSPMFRYVTASLDPGRLRGASLSTLPLELGIKIGAYVAKNAANTAAHGTLQPAITSYQNAVQKYDPMGLTQLAAQTAYDVSGAAAKVGSVTQKVDEEYDQRRDIQGQVASGEGAPYGGATLIGSEEGPVSPFPLKFSGTVTKGFGRSRQGFGLPTATLKGIAEETVLRLSGVYIAWATISKPKLSRSKLKSEKSTLTPVGSTAESEKAALTSNQFAALPQEAYDKWYQALVTVAAVRDRQAKVTEEKHASVYLLNDFGGATFYDAKMNVMLMAYMRPAAPITLQIDADPIAEQAQVVADVATVLASLSRPAWTADETLERMKSNISNQTLAERLGDVRSMGQRQVDKVPLHKLGIRTNSMGLKDQLIGTGGICVKR